MKTLLHQNAISKKLAGESANSPSYYAYGTGTQTISPSTTSLNNELTRGLSVQTYSDCVSTTTYIIPSTSDAGNTITELGQFDAASSGILHEIYEFPSGITHTAGNDIEITDFGAVVQYGSSNAYITDSLVNEINDYLTGQALSYPSYVGFGTYKILQQCDSVGSWTDDSSAATTPTADTYNYLEGTGAIKMGKDGTGAATFKYNITLAGQVDCSTITKFGLKGFRIEDITTLNTFKSTGAVIIKIGNDSSNYKYYSFDRVNLIVGWQRLEFNVSDMTTTGSVNMAQIDFLEILMETNNASDTITHGYLHMDYWYGSEIISCTSTNLTNQIIRQLATIRRDENTIRYSTTLAKADGNTYVYNQVGLFVASSGGNVLLINQHSDKIKDATIQIRNESNISVTIR